ncbi:MAG: hypothetical protein H8F28_03460 [Fibrella sp.]|nr:hypothetical protein [Armatimonadota bacterium]
MRPETIVALAVPLFLIGFAGFWCLIVLSISYASGWQSLSKRFRAMEKPQGRFFWLESITMNSARYQGAVILGVTERGLYLAPLAIFRVGHQPLLIPWNAFRAFRTEKLFWTVVHSVEIITENESSVVITFHNAQIAAAIQAWTTHASLQQAR